MVFSFSLQILSCPMKTRQFIAANPKTFVALLLYALFPLLAFTLSAEASPQAADKAWEKKLGSCSKASRRALIPFSEFKSKAQFASFARGVENYTYIASSGRMYGMTSINGSAMKCFSEGYLNKVENYCSGESPAYQGVCRSRTVVSGNQLIYIGCPPHGPLSSDNPACTVQVKAMRIR